MENREEMQTEGELPTNNVQVPEGRLSRKLLNDLKYKCETKGCRLKFKSHDELNDHKGEHSRTRPHGCKFCTATFTQASNLKRHEKMHKGLKPYDCETCNRKFTSGSNLKQHLATHNSRIERKKARCLMCSKEYMYKCSLIKHIKEDHNITANPGKYLTIITATEAADEEKSSEFEPVPSKRIFSEVTGMMPQYQNPIAQPLRVQIPISNQLINLQTMPVQPAITIQPAVPMQTSQIPMNLSMDAGMLRQTPQTSGCSFIRVKDYLNFISAQQRVAMAQNLMKMYSVQKAIPSVFPKERAEANHMSELVKAEENENSDLTEDKLDSQLHAFAQTERGDELESQSLALKKEEL